MRNLRHHAAKASVVGPHHYSIDLLQAQRADNGFVLFGAADRAADQLDLDGWSRHAYPIFSRVNPRISATCALSRSCSSALMVAFTTLWGLCEPSDLIST